MNQYLINKAKAQGFNAYSHNSYVIVEIPCGQIIHRETVRNYVDLVNALGEV